MDEQTKKEEKTIVQLDFDQILEHIGPHGRYQLTQLPILFVITTCCAISVVLFAFTGYVPKYRCIIPECENVSTATYYDRPVMPYENRDDLSFAEFVKLGIGGIKNDIDAAGVSCQRLSINQDKDSLTCEEYMDALRTRKDSLEVITCSRHDLVYDKSIVESSVTGYYDLACDHLVVRSIFNSLYMGGMLIGAFLIGLVSDKFGRIKALTLSVFLMGGSGLLAAFVQNRVLFALLRITVGMGGMGSYMSSYIIAAEGTLPRYKVITCVIVGLGFNVGELLLALEAYFIRDWFTLQIVAHGPMMLLLGIYFLVPESTRWLIAKGKTEEAVITMSRRASINHAEPIPMEMLTGRELFNDIKEEVAKIEPAKPPSVVDLFKHPTIRWRTIIMCYEWFSVTMGYYGLLFASTGLNGDPYLNFLLVVLAELPSVIFFLIFPNLVGRKVSLIASQLISGICCVVGGLLLIVPEVSALQVALVMVGRLAAAHGFGMVYLYTTELFPTSIRNTATGTCSSMARVGGICALLMEGLRTIWPPFPFLIFGSVAITAGALAFRFPETRNDKLPETIDDALALGQNIRRNKFGFILDSEAETK